MHSTRHVSCNRSTTNPPPDLASRFCLQVCVRFIEEAQKQIDWAISQALLHSKPAYIEVACNLAGTVCFCVNIQLSLFTVNMVWMR